MPAETRGVVYLVGAGPGDPGLLTIRGAECIRRSDIIVYDRLAHPDTLRHAPDSAELVYVGKEAGRHTMRQEDINRVLVDSALAGKTVCRLKGGDPYVFGRGGEEAEACFDAGVPFEVVPGISSSIAGPAYAGIPVTHRDSASSFAVITGHEDPSKPESRIKWEHLAHGVDTLIFLMGVENLPGIVRNLLQAGRSPDTPVALVRWATLPRQETIVSTLSRVEQETAAAGFKAPAVTIVGEVVNLRERLRWFDRLPLFGKRVLVTRAREQASALSDRLRELGAEPVEFPVIRIAPLSDYSELDRALGSMDEYDWIVFTSSNSVKAVADRLGVAETDSRAFASLKIAAMGPATEDALRAIGLRADFVPSRAVAESAVEEWPEIDMTGRKVLFPRARIARELLPDRLRAMGALVDLVPAYETVLNPEGATALREQLESGEVDAVTFASSSSVTNLVESLGIESAAALLRGILVVSIGPITTQSAKEAGIQVDIEAADHTIPGMIEALTSHFTEGN